MITRIQDETHRFALAYHRNLRGKTSLFSILDDIEGIGPARKKSLLKHYGGLEGIKKATLDDLKEVKSMSEKAAKNVYNFFHS